MPRRFIPPVLLLASLFATPAFGQQPSVDPAVYWLLGRDRGALQRPLDEPLAVPRDTVPTGPLRGLIALDWQGPGGQPRVGMLIRLRDPGALDDLRAAGARINSVIGDIVTARVPLSAVERLTVMPGIDRLEVARVLEPVNDSAAIAINVDGLRSWNGTEWDGFTGQDVVVGLYDTGVDYEHEDFLGAQGETRILGLWDQTQPGNPPPNSTFTYGNYCDPSTLDNGTCPQRDFNGHGTHVAGIAAGDGSAGPGDPRYAGVAPEADLLIVKGGNASFGEDQIVDGINWIFQEAERLGKPAVVNLSLGGHFGPHDGTRLHEIAIDNLVGAGRIMTLAAGNEGSNPVLPAVEPAFLHAMADPVLDQADQFTIEIPAFDAPTGTCDNYALLDLWYDGSDQFEITVERPDGSSLTVLFGESDRVESPDGAIEIFNAVGGPNPENGDHEAVISVDNCEESGPPEPGLWMIRVTPTQLGAGETYHLWIADSILGDPPQFAVGRDGFDNSHTVAMPGTSQRGITVGAFVTRRCWPTAEGTACYNPDFRQPLGSIAFFSSIGPTRDGRLKPEITAPGFGVVSALSEAANPDPILVTSDGEHLLNQGTSMSAPMMAGAVALMLEQSPGITPEQLKDILAETAITDEFTDESFTGLPGDGGTPNFTWGFGKLDVLAALQRIGDFATIEVAVQGAVPSTEPVTEAGALIPLLRLDLTTDSEEAETVSALGFDVTGNDVGDARVVVYRDVNGNGSIEAEEALLGRSEPVSLPPGDTVAVTVPVDVELTQEIVSLVVAVSTSGAAPNAAVFRARFDPQSSTGPGVLIRAANAEATEFQAPVRTTVLRADEIFALSENPVRSESVIFNFSEPPTMLAVYTLSGRRVVDLLPEIGSDLRVEWDLTNSEGNKIVPGVYVLVFRVADRLEREKLIVLRPSGGGE